MYLVNIAGISWKDITDAREAQISHVICDVCIFNVNFHEFRGTVRALEKYTKSIEDNVRNLRFFLHTILIQSARERIRAQKDNRLDEINEVISYHNVVVYHVPDTLAFDE